MKTASFRKLITAKSIDSVLFENHVLGEKEFIFNPDTQRIESVFVPFVGTIWANHKVALRLPHSVYVWFNIHRCADGSFEYLFDYAWKAGPGKKMRRDAAWNLVWGMMEETDCCFEPVFTSSSVEDDSAYYSAKEDRMSSEDGPLNQMCFN